jgi:hypothetical protein
MGSVKEISETALESIPVGASNISDALKFESDFLSAVFGILF